jgi:hypothetical protein
MEREDRNARATSRKLKEIVLAGIEAMAVCRDMPDEVIQLANRELRLAEPKQRGRRYGLSMGLDHMFGLRHSTHFDVGCPSAWKGPFRFLLRYHPEKSMTFIVDLLEHCTEWYAHPRFHDPHVGTPPEVVLIEGHGGARRVWCDERLWFLYRGGSVAPDVLRCALMALEHWLLEQCEADRRTVPAHLDFLLRKTTSAAVVSVVASVVTAHPRLGAAAALALLRTPAFVLLDRARMAREQMGMAAFLGAGPGLDYWDRFFQQERRDSNRLPHRTRDLEWVSIQLQAKRDTATEVERIIDAHRAAVAGSTEPQEVELWQLALHRMDLRRYRAVVEPRPEMKGLAAEAAKAGSVLYELGPPEPNVQEMLKRESDARAPQIVLMNLLGWSLGVFDPTLSSTSDPRLWRDYLAAARSMAAPPRNMDGRGIVAAICVRDHWDELDEAARAWCLERVCATIASAPASHDFDRMALNPMSGAGPSAWAIGALPGRALTAQQQSTARTALANALTHPIEDVVLSACRSIGEVVWAADRPLALHCANALAGSLTRLLALHEAEEARPYRDRRPVEELEDELRPETRAALLGPLSSDYRAIEHVAPAGWLGARRLLSLMYILANATEEPLAHRIYRSAAEMVAATWRGREHRRHGGHDEDEEEQLDLPPQIQQPLDRLLELFVLRLPPTEAIEILKPMIDFTNESPGWSKFAVWGLCGRSEELKRESAFWPLWQAFADEIRRADWLPSIDEEHPNGDEVGLVRAIFLGGFGRDGLRHWKGLDGGHASRVHSFFDSLPPSSTVLESYVRFLFEIGEQSLPDAFIRLSAHLQRSGARATEQLRGRNSTVFMVETMLRRHVYGRPVALKMRPELRDAVILLLDALIDAGSSAAYLMRDDFVTPLPAA